MIDKQWSIEKDGFLYCINKEITRWRREKNMTPSYLVLGKKQLKELETCMGPYMVLVKVDIIPEDGWKQSKYQQVWGLDVVPIGLEDYFEVL